MKKGFSQFVAPGSQDAFYSHRKRALESGTRQVSDLELKGKNGRSFYAQFQSVVVEGNEGNAIQLRTAIVDITRRKLAEVALSESHSQLEGRIEERTTELRVTNADLQKEIEERKRMGESLKKSASGLRFLSSRLLTIQEAERRQIALELHDSIAQSLVAARLFLRLSLDAKVDCPLPGVSMERVFSMLGDCVDELRRIIDGLRPSVLTDLGVTNAVESFCAKFQSLNKGIEVKREITAQEEGIPTELKIVIYRILQEAMNNISRHSGAKTVKVFLRNRKDGIELGIEDDGAGFDVNDPTQQGLGTGIGLSSMRERAHLSEGAISIQSRKGIGTTVVVSWHY